MRNYAIAKTILIGILMALIVSPVTYSAEKKEEPSQPTDSTSAVAPSQIIETLIVDWPKKDKWTKGLDFSEGANHTELYYPEGQSASGWKEMASVETVIGKTNVNIPGMARMTFLGTERGSPNATWDILKKGRNERNRHFIIYEIICPDFLSEEPPQIQLWKMVVGKTALFTLQYGYRGKEMPDERRKQILEMLDKAYIAVEEK
jgi:hypothetical protein